MNHNETSNKRDILLKKPIKEVDIKSMKTEYVHYLRKKLYERSNITYKLM